MSNIIGPFLQEDWCFLVDLRRSIAAYPKEELYMAAVKKETRIYNNVLARYKEAA